MKRQKDGKTIEISPEEEAEIIEKRKAIKPEKEKVNYQESRRILSEIVKPGMTKTDQTTALIEITKLLGI